MATTSAAVKLSSLLTAPRTRLERLLEPRFPAAARRECPPRPATRRSSSRRSERRQVVLKRAGEPRLGSPLFLLCHVWAALGGMLKRKHLGAKARIRLTSSDAGL